MIKGKKKLAVIIAALAAVTMITGTAAYFTASDEAVNTWTVGNVEIDLEEPEYDDNKDEETGDIMPNEELHKDPQVTNSGNNEAFVFMKVRIPKAVVKVAGQDGSVPASATLQELFDYQWNTGWTSIDTHEIKDGNTTYQEYLLTYGTANECKALNPGETTPVLFINASGNHIANPGAKGMITFKNVIEGQGLENVALNIKVESYAIQAENLTTTDTKVPSKVWDILTNQAGA
jgi:predicted ribosomally synthesized peptide with SipW-like signal peptide